MCRFKLFLFLILIPILGIGQECNIHFKKIDVENGLNTSYVNDIKQDEYGFLWIATDDGINRFDGREALSIRKGIDSIALGFENAKSLGVLPNQKILVGGNNGQLQLLDLINSKSDILLANTLNGKTISGIEISRDKIYLNLGDELLVLNADDFVINEQLSNPKTGKIHFLKKDIMGIVWMSAETGLYILRDGGKLSKIPKTTELNLIDITSDKTGYWAINENHIYAINSQLQVNRVDIKGFNPSIYNFKVIAAYKDNLLLGSESSGFWVLDVSNNTVSTCQNQSEAYPYYSKINRSVLDLNGNMFLCTAGDGVVHLNLKAVFSPFNVLAIKDQRFYNANVHFVAKSKLYLLLNNQIQVYDKDLNPLKNIQVRLNTKTDFNSMVYTNAKFYLGSKNGITILDSIGREIDQVKHNSSNDLSIQSNEITALSVDGDRIIIGTRGGLAQLNPRTEIAKRFENVSAEVLAVSASKNALFVADPNGIYKVETDFATKLDVDGISQSNYASITSLFAEGGILWLGTNGNGAYKLKLENNNKFFVNGHYSTELSNSSVTSITIDQLGQIWLGTRFGLNRLKQNENTVSRFYSHNGLVSENFNQGFAYSFNGNLLFGSRRGLVSFNSTQIDDNVATPQIVLTNASVAGKAFKNQYEVMTLSELEVDYFDFGFTLEFAAIDFNAADKINYIYKMEGLGNEWISLSNSNEVTFSNLPEGKYTLLIKAISSLGNSSANEIKLNITIKPPFYSAMWFRVVLISLLVITGLSIYFYRINRERSRSKLLEFEVDKRTRILREQNDELELAKEKALASDKAKSEFMATMSHEIRTPMNGILGSVGLLEQGILSQEQKEQLSIITECGDNMLAIINEILDYSKIESGKLKAVIDQFDLIESIKNTIESHSSRAHAKGLELTCFIAPNVPRLIESDKNRISQIINNLISNAVKFTKKGSVHCEIDLGENSNDHRLPLRITVTDTGIGIPKEKQAEIWDAFSQVDNSSTREFGGTGLGLAIVKSMTQLLGGYLTLRSEEGKGSSFIIEIPVDGQKREAKDYQVAKKKMLIATSGIKTNLAIERYASELGFESIVVQGLNELSAVNDDAKYDALFVDSLTMTYDFYSAWKDLSEKVILVVPVEDKLNLKLESGISAVITKPVWRTKFQALFIEKFKEKAEKKVAEINDPDAYKNVRILLAEDNKVNQIVTKKIISKLGLELDIAVNGQEAIDKFKETEYDLILMDLLMPEVDGTQATQSIREIKDRKQPYIVAFSANIFNKDLAYFEAQGFNNVLSKPAKVEEMVKLLNDVATKGFNS